MEQPQVSQGRGILVIMVIGKRNGIIYIFVLFLDQIRNDKCISIAQNVSICNFKKCN